MRLNNFAKKVGRELQADLAGSTPEAWPAIEAAVRRAEPQAESGKPRYGKRKWKFAAAAIAVAVCAACVPLFSDLIPVIQAEAKTVYDNGGRLSDVSSEKCSEDFIESYNTFGLDLLKQLDASGKKNVFLSPASVYLALGMTYGGADGRTAEGFVKTLRLSGNDFPKFGENCRGLQAMMTGDSFRLANAIWIDNGFRGRISDSFLDRDRAYFGASVGTLRFASSAAPKIIGDWIRKNTNDRIDPKIKEFDPDTVMLLANTIYFKSDWKDQFDANNTRDDVFHALSGDKTLKFMHGMRGGYFEDETLQGIRLPYEDGKTSLLILLPKKDLSGMASSLSAEKLAAFLRQGRESKESAQLSLPRVHFSYDATLNDALKAMGLAEAFGGQADFGGMLRPGGGNLAISKVQHMTALSIDEKGTEAAAATTVAMVASAPVMEHEMNVDHPFFAAIMNDESGAALFAGVIADPSAGE